MGVCGFKKNLVLAGALFFCLASPVEAFRVSLFVPRADTLFWSSLVRLTESAAQDLDVDLRVYDAENRGEAMVRQVREACLQGTDGILFMNYEHLGREILTLAQTYKVPALLYNTGFADPRMVPRKEFPFWIGSMTPDDVRAGGLLAQRLIEAGKRAGKETIRMLAIEGNPQEKSSSDRVEGMRAVVSNRDDVILYGVVNAGKTWSRTKAKEVFTAEFRKHPDINTVWAAGDDIALGALDAVSQMGLDRETVIAGGIDWSQGAVESVRAGHNGLSIGGHMLEGAWALILMHDYLGGLDFSRENTVFKTRMHAIDSRNVDQVSRFLTDNWERIDFTNFSKVHNETLLYRFELPHVMDTFYPKKESLHLTAAERRWLAEHPTIRLGVDCHWPPFESVDSKGHYRGMVADYVRVLEDRLGVRCVYSTEMSWAETLQAMDEHRLDMLSAIGALPQHRQAMRLTKPFLAFPLVVITNHQVNYVEDLKALGSRKIAVVNEYSEYKILAENYPNMEPYLTDSTSQALEAVATGKAYAYVGNLAEANYVIKNERLTNLKVSGTIPQKLQISMAVRKDWPMLATLVEKAMNSISEEERDSIYHRWIPLRYEHGFDYGLLWKLGATAVFVLSVFLYWNRRLVALNRKLKQEITVRVETEEALRQEQDRVKQLVVTDPLTGLYNRRKFKEVFPLEIRRLRRSGRYLAFVVMDIDHFKQYNDHYGHQMGDEALSRVGQLLLQRCKRATDYSFRLGGEEFGILFLARDPSRARAFVENIRLAIYGLGIQHAHNPVADGLTVSMGLVVSDSPSTLDAMYKAADQALYRAKEAGRNRTEMTCS